MRNICFNYSFSKSQADRSRKLFSVTVYFLLIIAIMLMVAVIAPIPAEASAPITGTYVPDGVYAIKNVATGKYMKVESNSPDEGLNLIEYNYTSDPSSSSQRAGLFKIERVGTSNRYIIRNMTNNYNSFAVSGTDILTTEISNNNSSVSSLSTWVISNSTSGYTFRQYLKSNYISVQDSANSDGTANLKIEALTTAGDRAKWQLIPLDSSVTIRGIGYYGGSASVPKNVAIDQTHTIKIYMYSSTIGDNSVRMSMRSEDTGYATITNNASDHTFSITGTNVGVVRTIFCIDNTSGTTSVRYTGNNINVIPIEEGVYSFRCELFTNKYMSTVSFEGGRLTQKVCGRNPVEEFNRDGLFKVALKDDGSYVIRSMVYNALTVCPSGTFASPYPSAYYEWEENNEITDNRSWTFVKTSDGKYQIITKETTNYTGKAICVGATANANADSNNSDDPLTLEDPAVAGSRSKWIASKYSGNFSMAAVPRYTQSHLMEMGAQKNISGFFNNPIFYSTNEKNYPGDVTGYIVSNYDGGNTNIATISSSGILTAAPGKVGIVAVRAIYSSFAVSCPIYIYINPGEGEYFFLQNLDLEEDKTTGHKYIQATNSNATADYFNYDSSQLWEIVRFPNLPIGDVMIRNVATGQYLTSPESTLANEAVTLSEELPYVKLFYGSGRYWEIPDPRQRWSFITTDSGTVKIQSAYQYTNAPTMYLKIMNSTNNILVQGVWTSDSNYLDEFNRVTLGNEVVLLGSDTFNVIASPDLSGLAIAKHLSMYGSANYDTFGIHPFVTTNSNTVISLMDNAKIYVQLAHGSPTSQALNRLQNSSLDVSDMANVDLSNLDLVIFLGCKTGAIPTEGVMNLPQMAVSRGATAAIGFKESTGGITRNANPGTNAISYLFLEALFNYLTDGDDLYDACRNSCNNMELYMNSHPEIYAGLEYVDTRYDSFEIYYKEGVNSFYLN